jgi:ABC-type bacteriocin/lantibiotic exporter with double-glycine peptidase domain
MQLASLFARFRRLSPFVLPYIRRIVLVFFLSLFATVLGLLWPLFTKILIDDVLLARDLSLLFTLCGIMLGVTILSYGVGAINRYVYTQVTARVLFALRQHLFGHLQNLSLRFHTQARVGDLLSRLNTDIAEIQSVLTDAAFTFVMNILVLFAAIGFLVWLDWKLFLLSLLVVPLQIYGVRKVQPYMVEQTRRVRELNASISAFLVESLSAIKFVKQFGVEQIQLRQLGTLGEQFVRVVTRYEMLGYLGSTAVTATTFLGSVLVTLYGGYLVIQGQLSIGGLIAFAAYQSRAFSPLQVLMDLYLRIERASVSVDRVFEFLDIDKEYTEQTGGGLQLEDLRGVLEFREVSFAYQPAEPVLQQVSFRLPAGQRLTILGPSGTGKSTVVDLIIRLYEPSAGTISLDGHDVRDFDVAWLRKRIVVIGNEPFLFHASVLENMCYASPQTSRDDALAAARAVGLHEFVVTLPHGYDTVVGERGTRLSAGQRQRIALARAVLKKPKILVLDEAMSGLDTASEADVRLALMSVLPGCTILVVTHRLTALHNEDAVIVLKEGRVVWHGVYAALTEAPEMMYIATE